MRFLLERFSFKVEYLLEIFKDFLNGESRRIALMKGTSKLKIDP